jgi:hypothetical protein
VKLAARAFGRLLPALVLLAACREDVTAPPVDAAVDAATADAAEVETVDATAEDVIAEDTAAEEVGTDAAAPGSFGQPCVVGRSGGCADGLICLQGPAGGRTGFCSRTCPRTSSGACAGAPPGTAAFCLVTNVNAAGDKGCAFVCLVRGMTHACPGELRCAADEDPPGSGQRLCLP